MSKAIVAKFGGTSVATPVSIEKIAKIVSDNKRIKFVVVSAVSGVTNLLVKLCQVELALRSSIAKEVLNIHLKLSMELNLDLEFPIRELIKRLDEVHCMSVTDSKMTDYIVSLGEDLSCLIITAYLNQQGIEAKYLDAREFLITDDNYGNASPDLVKIKSYEFPEGLCVTQGFVGATSSGNTTTLGRGGSDYSAALIAERINGSELLIYTDVPGVYTIDPNICQSAMLIPRLDFHTMARMANLGAKVLHPATIEPCIRARIPVRIMSTFEPDEPGTSIGFYNNEDYRIKSVAIRKNQLLVTIKNLKVLNTYNFFLNTFNIFMKYKVGVDLCTTTDLSDLHISFVVNILDTGADKLNQFIQNKELLDELQRFAEVTVEGNLTLVSVIDNRLAVNNSIQNVLAKIDSYKIRFVCYGASDSVINILVAENHAVDIAKSLHNYLLEIESCNV